MKQVAIQKKAKLQKGEIDEEFVAQVVKSLEDAKHGRFRRVA